jgi:hypothetical protein
MDIKIVLKSFESPDEAREMEKGRFAHEYAKRT